MINPRVLFDCQTIGNYNPYSLVIAGESSSVVRHDHGYKGVMSTLLVEEKNGLISVYAATDGWMQWLGEYDIEDEGAGAKIDIKLLNLEMLEAGEIE